MKKLLVLLPLALAACATLTAESDQVISINTTPAGASCTISNSQQSQSIASTPSNVIVNRAFEPLDVLCMKDGMSGRARLEAKTRGRAYGNILLLGVPALVDMSSGAGYEYEPGTVEVTLSAPAPVTN